LGSPALLLCQEHVVDLIGITGGIACGKTALVTVLRELGYKVIEVDEISHEIMQAGMECTKAVIKEFPQVEVFGGSIDRKALANMVFKNPYKRITLEHITRLFYAMELTRLMQLYKETEDIAFLSSAMLVEHKLDVHCEEIWSVYAEPDVQVRRLIHRDHLTLDQAEARIQSQMSASEKAKHGYVVFDTTYQFGFDSMEEKAVRQIARYKRERNTYRDGTFWEW